MKKIDLKKKKEEERKKAIKEVEIMEMVDHPHIVKYHWSFVEANYLVIIMEYIDGGDLSQLI